jgi:hypothetical protein
VHDIAGLKPKTEIERGFDGRDFTPQGLLVRLPLESFHHGSDPGWIHYDLGGASGCQQHGDGEGAHSLPLSATDARVPRPPCAGVLFGPCSAGTPVNERIQFTAKPNRV